MCLIFVAPHMDENILTVKISRSTVLPYVDHHTVTLNKLCDLNVPKMIENQSENTTSSGLLLS